MFWHCLFALGICTISNISPCTVRDLERNIVIAIINTGLGQGIQYSYTCSFALALKFTEFALFMYMFLLYLLFCPERKYSWLAYLLKLPCRYFFLFTYAVFISMKLDETLINVTNFCLHFYKYSKFVQQYSDEEMGEIEVWSKSRTLYLPRPMTRTACQP